MANLKKGDLSINLQGSLKFNSLFVSDDKLRAIRLEAIQRRLKRIDRETLILTNEKRELLVEGSNLTLIINRKRRIMDK